MPEYMFGELMATNPIAIQVGLPCRSRSRAGWNTLIGKVESRSLVHYYHREESGLPSRLVACQLPGDFDSGGNINGCPKMQAEKVLQQIGKPRDKSCKIGLSLFPIAACLVRSAS